MDPETRKMLQNLQKQVEESNKIKGAVNQLEDQMKGLPKTLENKIAAVQRTMFDGHGRYRGVLGSEAEARSFGLFMMASVGGDQHAAGALKAEFKDLHERAMGDDPSSSPMVPVEFSDRIQRLVEEAGIFAANAFPMPMTSDKLTFQRRVRGLKVFKTGANQAVEGSEPEFDTVDLNAEEWNTLVLYPKALGEDAAAAIGELLAMEISQAFAEQIDDSGFIGDGTPDSLDVVGIVQRLRDINLGGNGVGAGLVRAGGSAGSGWDGIEEDDLLKIMGQVRHVRGNGKWYCSNEFYWRVGAKIVLSKGGVTAAEFEGQRGFQLLGAPVEITPSMPRVSGHNQVAALFGDVRLSSTHGRRRELFVEQSTQARFIERQVAVLGTQRHAINNHTLGDAETAGPVVGLLTPEDD